MTDAIRYLCSFFSDQCIPTFSERALWAAGESQKATALPALVAVASGGLLVVVLWIWAVRAVIRHA